MTEHFMLVGSCCSGDKTFIQREVLDSYLKMDHMDGFYLDNNGKLY